MLVFSFFFLLSAKTGCSRVPSIFELEGTLMQPHATISTHSTSSDLFLLFFFSHRNVAVRKTAAQFLSLLAERMGVSRLMSGAKDVTEKILPTAAQFLSDGGPETRCMLCSFSSTQSN